MIWIVSDVVARAFFNSPIPGTMEITGEYFMVLIVFLAISYTYKIGGHVNVELLQSKFSNRINGILKVICNLFIIPVLIMTVLANFNKGIEFFTEDIRTVSTLNYPLAPALMIITLGLVLLTLRLILETISILQGKKEFK
nr:TRAP transporter small permease [Mesobacillus harenae]